MLKKPIMIALTFLVASSRKTSVDAMNTQMRRYMRNARTELKCSFNLEISIKSQNAQFLYNSMYKKQRKSHVQLYSSSSSIQKKDSSNIEKTIFSKIKHSQQKRASNENDENKENLDWEQFEFGDNPKQDNRFADASHIIQHADDDTFQDIVTSEIKEDEKLKLQLDEHNAALSALEPELVQKATAILQEFVTDDRIERLNDVLSKRTQNCRFLFENPGNPSNVWACLRTVDSFGIQNVDIVIDSSKYTKKAAIAQKQSTRTAMGSAKWITLHSHSSTALALQVLREQGYKIYASDLNPNSKDIRALDWGCSVNSHQSSKDDENNETKNGKASKICIVMGNEDVGISDEMREGADETFTLPMVGFAESFNLSVATAITLAHISAKGDNGPIKAGDLDEHEINCLRLKWMMNSLAQKRMGNALLKKHGIKLPNNFHKI